MSALSLLLSVVLLAPTGGADEARRFYQTGSDAYRTGRYTVAIEAFEAAHGLSQRPIVIYSLAQAHRLQYFVDGDPHKLARAVALYREYLAAAGEGGRRAAAAQHLSTLTPLLERRRAEGDSAARAAESKKARLLLTADVDGATVRVDDQGRRFSLPNVLQVEPGIHALRFEADEHAPAVVKLKAVAGQPVPFAAELEPLPARLTVLSHAGAKVAIDGGVLGTAPLAQPAQLEAGRHLLTVSLTGRDLFQRSLDLERGEALRVEAPLSVSRQRLVAWGLFGTAALLAGGATWAGLSALDEANRADDIEARGRRTALTVADVERYRGLEGARDDARDVALGLGAAATGALITGVVLWVFDDPAP